MASSSCLRCSSWIKEEKREHISQGAPQREPCPACTPSLPLAAHHDAFALFSPLLLQLGALLGLLGLLPLPLDPQPLPLTLCLFALLLQPLLLLPLPAHGRLFRLLPRALLRLCLGPRLDGSPLFPGAGLCLCLSPRLLFGAPRCLSRLCLGRLALLLQLLLGLGSGLLEKGRRLPAA